MRNFLAILVTLFCSALLHAEAPLSPSNETSLPATFLDISSLDYTSVLQPPPAEGSYFSETDKTILHYSMDAATPDQISYAMSFIEDSVFDYSEVLGSTFNKGEYPTTAAIFEIITADVCRANGIAKNYFKHPHPDTWRKMSDDDLDFDAGYSYPSAHASRAFVWAELLSQLLPQYEDAFFKEAEKKSWSRVIIGRHYPSDVCAGKIYAHYLVQKFHENPDFQKAWNSLQQEVSRNSSLVTAR